MDSGAARLDHDQAAAALSDRDRRILEFERQWWKYAGAKEQAIRDLFEMSSTRYYQILNGLIDTPEALAFDPMLVKRLRRMRSARQRVRSARRLGVDLDARESARRILYWYDGHTTNSVAPNSNYGCSMTRVSVFTCPSSPGRTGLTELDAVLERVGAMTEADREALLSALRDQRNGKGKKTG